MARPPTTLTGVERTFGRDEIIVSKTDPKGRITYANEVFIRVAQYSEAELLGQAHSIVRHPDMPRCVFQFLWDTIQAGNECFAYVLNRAKSGDHYWVFAHITPTFNEHGQIIAYHSNRRCPDRGAVEKIRGVYNALLAAERKFQNPRDQVLAGLPVFVDFLKAKKTTYEELIFAL